MTYQVSLHQEDQNIVLNFNEYQDARDFVYMIAKNTEESCEVEKFREARLLKVIVYTAKAEERFINESK